MRGPFCHAVVAGLLTDRTRSSKQAPARSIASASKPARIVELRCPLKLRQRLTDETRPIHARISLCNTGQCLCIADDDSHAGADEDRREIPAVIGPYRVEKRLGQGGMGEVYRAYDQRLGRRVALKLLRRDVHAKPRQRERLRREALVMARLDHPAIVQIYDVLDTAIGNCIVLEYVEGRTLAEILAREGTLEISSVLGYGSEIAGGLARAHEHGLVHRDLKTENVMITSDGHAKILDFGMAKQLDPNGGASKLTVDGTFVGTFRAMSPEQVSQRPVDHRSDLFSFGTLLYEALAGRNPFASSNVLATMLRIATHRQKPLSELDVAIPRELSELVDHLLAKDPARRPASAREVATLLHHLAASRSIVRSFLIVPGSDGRQGLPT